MSLVGPEVAAARRLLRTIAASSSATIREIWWRLHHREKLTTCSGTSTCWACHISDAYDGHARQDRVAAGDPEAQRDALKNHYNRHIYLPLECKLFMAPLLLPDTKAKLRSHETLDTVSQL